MSSNTNLNNASVNKKDEFYTQLSDIENELQHYQKYFKNKTVLCNCDDPRISNFFKYFSLNFKHLKLKKLITTCYKSKNLDYFTKNNSKKAVKLEYDGYKFNNKVPEPHQIGIVSLESDGDFRSKECVEILKEVDIVCTNPPFSLFREFVAQLIEHKKKFIIIGNQNAITYKKNFPLIRDNKLWLGPSIQSGDREFGVPDNYPLNAAGSRVDENGKKFIRVKGVRWFTNIGHKKRHEYLLLSKKYNKTDYLKYDNYNAINVDKTKDIPLNYEGIMGVPITFMDKYNPKQFKIVGLIAGNIKGLAGIVSSSGKDGPYINGKLRYGRILIQNRSSL